MKDGGCDLLEEFDIDTSENPISMEDLELLRADIESDKSPQDSPSDDAQTFDLPKYVRPLTSLPPDDMTYLHNEGAFDLPDGTLQSALLRAFFEYVHPYVPTLDLDGFLHAIETHDGSAGQVSLLLLQAVLAAGTAHVELDYLRNAGFQTRKQARTTFMKRVRVSFLQRARVTHATWLLTHDMFELDSSCTSTTASWIKWSSHNRCSSSPHGKTLQTSMERRGFGSTPPCLTPLQPD